MNDLMTMTEVAEHLRIPVATLRHWRYRNMGPRSFKLGARVMYRRVDVEAFLDAVSTGPTAAGAARAS